ncbi:MAG TPA: helix-turn-helix transcriptional regulator, partial [Vicinamibacteria bacterium]
MPAQLVARPRLLDRLDEGSARRVSLIAAPAGYGKTTLALQWLAERVGDSAWISLDDRASELERFMAYLVEAIRGVRPHALPGTAALLDARTPPPRSYLVECLLAELALVDAPLVLALDDCHSIASRDVHDLVRGMVESLPPGVHLLALGRTDPPWPLARWRGRGWVSELRARDLRFDRGEVREFFASADALALDPSDLDLLGDRTEGWPAGLQLARISIAQAPDPRERARRFSGDDRLVVDFLMSEVLAVQPPELRELLAVTAPLDRFCAPLCAHLLEGRVPARNAGALLDRLEQGNLFLVPLDAEHRWFRYHHLFRDLLLRHLAEAGSAEVRARVAGRAAAWFAREGLVEEAIGLWVAAGELDRAVELFGQNLHQALDADNSRRILFRWLELLPAGEARDRLPLLVARAYQAAVRADVRG